MIDKIKLFIKEEFYIKDNSDIQIASSRVSLKTGELKTNFPLFYTNKEHSGTPISGSKAFFLEEALSFKLSITININGLYVEYNPSKLYFKENEFYSVTNKQNDIITAKVQAELTRVGVMVDIHKMRLTRLDLCKDIELKEYYRLYADALQCLKRARSLTKKIGTTVMFGNKTWQTVFYDKISEMAHRGIEISPEYNIQGDVMRCEMRFFGAGTIRDKLSIHNLRTLSEFYEETKMLYIELIDDLFSSANINAKKEITNSKELIEAMKKKDKRGAFFKGIAVIGLQKLFELGELDLYFEGAKQSGYSDSQINKLRKECRDLLQLVPSSNNKILVSDLLNEMQEKLVIN